MGPVRDASEAASIAREFIAKEAGQRVVRLERAALEEKVWKVEFTVGALASTLAKVEIDAETGEVRKFELMRRP